VRVGPPVSPPEEQSVETWTKAIERALLDVTLNADDWEDHEIVAAVDALFSSFFSAFLSREFFLFLISSTPGGARGRRVSSSRSYSCLGGSRACASRDALVAECDRLAGVFRAATDNRSA
jgi:hypothetical protein